MGAEHKQKVELLRKRGELALLPPEGKGKPTWGLKKMKSVGSEEQNQHDVQPPPIIIAGGSHEQSEVYEGYTIGCRVDVLYDDGIWHCGTLKKGPLLRYGRMQFMITFDDGERIWTELPAKDVRPSTSTSNEHARSISAGAGSSRDDETAQLPATAETLEDVQASSQPKLNAPIFKTVRLRRKSKPRFTQKRQISRALSQSTSTQDSEEAEDTTFADASDELQASEWEEVEEENGIGGKNLLSTDFPSSSRLTLQEEWSLPSARDDSAQDNDTLAGGGGHSDWGGIKQTRFAEGKKVMVEDPADSKWYKARVVTGQSVDGNQIKVHFIGWNTMWDEWIDIESPRLAAFTPAKSAAPPRDLMAPQDDSTCKCCRRQFKSKTSLHIHIGMSKECKSVLWGPHRSAPRQAAIIDDKHTPQYLGNDQDLAPSASAFDHCMIGGKEDSDAARVSAKRPRSPGRSSAVPSAASFVVTQMLEQQRARRKDRSRSPMRGPWSPLSQFTQAITGDHDLLLTSHHQVNRISAFGENSVQEDQLVPCPPPTFQEPLRGHKARQHLAPFFCR